jgi:hypothetical protein
MTRGLSYGCNFAKAPQGTSGLALLLNRPHGRRFERIIEGEQESRFSPLAFQAWLKTGTVQARNRPIGTAMTLIKKKDVPSYFAAKRRGQPFVASPARKPGANADTVNLFEVPESPVVESPILVNSGALAPDARKSARV